MRRSSAEPASPEAGSGVGRGSTVNRIQVVASSALAAILAEPGARPTTSPVDSFTLATGQFVQLATW